MLNRERKIGKWKAIGKLLRDFLKYFKGQEITTFKSPTFPRQQSVLTEHLLLVASVYFYYFFSVCLGCASRKSVSTGSLQQGCCHLVSQASICGALCGSDICGWA